MLNPVGGLRSISNRAKFVLEFLRKDVFFFLDADDIWVLMSLRALVIRKPLRKIGVAAQAELPNLLNQICFRGSTEKGGLDVDNHI